jgi:hypothetical protein
MRLSAVAAAALPLVAASALAAQDITPAADARAVRATRTGSATVVQTPPVIDGRLDDAAWEQAAPLADFVQREPYEGTAETERTVVKLLTDGEALYVGAWLFDRDTAGIIPGERIRDVTLTNSDYFGIILDTYRDKQNGFVFATTPAAIEYDGQIIREGEGGGVFQAGQNRMQAGSMGGFNLNWDGSWIVRTSRDSAGWYAEFRIPFSTLRYGGGGQQTWGMNLVRGIRRKNEETFWSFIPRQFNLYRMSLAGALEGIEVPVRRIATVTPYVLASGQRNYLFDTQARYPREFGADLKYGVTPALTLDLTYNTDFAQVEVDEQRTNLTRFPLFFPEKRPFFLENAGIFSAGTPQAVDLFFTRRIGIDSTGMPVPTIGGGRLSGRIGGTTVGALQIYTDDAPERGIVAQAYTVGRVLREVGRRSRIGAIAVQRQGRGGNADDRNRTFGLDGRLGVGDDWTVDGWGGWTETPGRSGDAAAFSGRGAYLTRNWNNSVRIVQVGDAFNPEVGFLNRFGGYRFYEATLMRYVRKPEWAWFRQWNPHVSWRRYEGLDGFYQTGQVHVDLTEIEFNDGARFGPELNVYHEGIQEPFAIAPGVVLPPGSYDFAGIGLDWSSDPSAPLSFVLRGDFGPFWNGTRNGGNLQVTARRGASVSSSLVLDYNDVVLEQGAFIRSLIGYKLAVFLTPRVFVQTLTQFNNQQRIWSANIRFGWLSTAGTGLFVVFNSGEEADGFFRWVRPQTRSLVVKYTYQFGTGR